ncbi:PAS domain S-box-containing protein [Sphingomonas sp. SORGH_AS802]|uniref:methyl-accepting chemotaxis protein n=1 Tax=unclassified Sphingomonas TaxID=196159 RepID=UPI002854642F|nr:MULTISPECIES: PAS domain-containing methyl-accepting chemotaxis protein [unclassified Sphingomonas]MDR6125799.1 PAS domain S-box-containing protein [Sphingomonas sp. SORGH_AS_0438]MDR6134406.1 PAS domain S-box-containing protein [Sphingomonas sp. SORGH_AS_0802]
MIQLIGKDRQRALEWHDTLLTTCGVGLWDAVFPNGQAMHPDTIWTWSAEFRKMLGFNDERDFPNVVEAWSDRLHPEDAERVARVFATSVDTGVPYDVTYKIKMRDGRYRWVRAMGGVINDQNGRARRFCGSLIDVHVAKTLEEQQKQAVNHIRRIADALAAGDLTQMLNEDFPDGLSELKDSLNAAIANMRSMIGAVSESARLISSGSTEIAQASEDLARRTEANAASLEQTAASARTMDERLHASVHSANRTVERADETIATVKGGRAVADEAVQAMGRVSDSAKGIDSVIEGLDKIAFQTRVLAMNAAVEAGRAGDAGRGFAVVADLVSALAMRAEEEAKRARDQLTLTQTDIATAVGAVTKVDGALVDITDDVQQVHQLLATMATDNQAQSAAITQVSAAIAAMDRSTQQNAAMVEQTSAAARSLASEVGNLSEQASRFRTSGQSAGMDGLMSRVLPSSGIKPLPAAALPAMVRPAEEWSEF